MVSGSERIGRGAARFLPALCVLLALAFAVPSRAEDEIRTVSGRISWASTDAVEIGGTRGLLTPESGIFSQGRQISVTSLRRGMPATMELDAAGRILEVDARGVIE